MGRSRIIRVSEEFARRLERMHKRANEKLKKDFGPEAHISMVGLTETVKLKPIYYIPSKVEKRKKKIRFT